MIKIKDLLFKYDGAKSDFGLDVREFSLKAGQVAGILGESGSGKSTFLKICAGLETGFTGMVEVAGRALRHGDKRRFDGRVGYLFQDAPVFSGTVFDNAAIGLRIRREPEKIVKEKVLEILEMMNISGVGESDIKKVSGGQARRACLARILAMRPGLLLLDEPFFSLDSITKYGIMHDLKKYIEANRSSALLVTHDKNEVLALCETAAIMKNGEIIQNGSVFDCFYSPVSADAARLTGCVSVFYGRVASSADGVCAGVFSREPVRGEGEGARFELVIAGDYEPGDAVCAMINPDDVSVGTVPSEDDAAWANSSALNRFTGKITSIGHHEFGMLIKVRISSGIDISAYITRRSFVNLGLEKGNAVHLVLKATAVKSFKMP